MRGKKKKLKSLVRFQVPIKSNNYNAGAGEGQKENTLNDQEAIL